MTLRTADGRDFPCTLKPDDLDSVVNAFDEVGPIGVAYRCDDVLL